MGIGAEEMELRLAQGLLAEVKRMARYHAQMRVEPMAAPAGYWCSECGEQGEGGIAGPATLDGPWHADECAVANTLKLTKEET